MSVCLRDYDAWRTREPDLNADDTEIVEVPFDDVCDGIHHVAPGAPLCSRCYPNSMIEIEIIEPVCVGEYEEL